MAPELPANVELEPSISYFRKQSCMTATREHADWALVHVSQRICAQVHLRNSGTEVQA